MPRMNSIMERSVQTCRRELLDPATPNWPPNWPPSAASPAPGPACRDRACPPRHGATAARRRPDPAAGGPGRRRATANRIRPGPAPRPNRRAGGQAPRARRPPPSRSRRSQRRAGMATVCRSLFPGYPGCDFGIPAADTSSCSSCSRTRAGGISRHWPRSWSCARSGMSHSTFAQPLPASLADSAATGHHPGPVPVAGRWHTYP
jgi:hypothetical protein